MALSKFDKDMQIIQALDDEPNDVGGLTSAELKAKFDEGGEAVKQYINEILTEEVASREDLQGLILGQIPDGTITVEKLSTDVNLNINAHASRHATGGADPLTPEQIGAAVTTTLTATIPTGWTASGAYYYKDVSVPGMLATDNPIADILPGSDNAANKLYAEAWSKVQSGEPMNGTVRLWATSAPTTSFPLQFKITRTGNETGQGKCILAGHPPVGGQIGYGTYTGDYAENRFISLGVTPKWVLIFTKAGMVGLSATATCGGLAVNNSNCANPNGDAIDIASGGFNVHCKGTNYAVGTNRGDYTYNYIYGT